MLEQWVEQHRDDLLGFAARLVATPSPNPPGNEQAVVAVILAEMERLGLDVRRSPPRNRIDRTSSFGCAANGLEQLSCCAVTATPSPVGDAVPWRTDPLEPVFRDGRLYGLGSTDMKGAVAAMVYAAAALEQCDVDLAGELLLVIDADEERAMSFGSEYLAAECGIEADVALLGEPSGIDGPEFEFLHIVSRGLSCFKIRVRGTQMHSSLSDRIRSTNASLKLAEVLTRMHTDLRLTFEPHPLCAAPTVNLGVKIEGGVGYGVYPGVAEFQSDIRTLPGMTHEQLKTDLERCLERIRREDPSLDVELEFEKPPLDWFPPTEVNSDHPLIDILLDVAQHVVGRRPKLSAFPGGTDAKNFQTIAGIPTIPSFGPGWLPLAHGPNECVGIEAIVQAAKMYALMAQRYLKAES